MKTLLFIQKNFSGLTQLKESWDMILAAASLAHRVSVLFMDEGVFQLISAKESELGKLLAALPFYDIQNMYVAEKSLTERGFSRSNLIFPATCLLEHELGGLLNAHEKVF